jgi:hypothetical protein
MFGLKEKNRKKKKKKEHNMLTYILESKFLGKKKLTYILKIL